ncbi:hypothetical protein R69619_01704 [Paraburkholderia nemoris]|uniref:recombinase family protein n=1 Tax=Paraburkholderia nemoris TaxID=2793076 RepID=UPI00190DDB9C|nr:recombinase family protein [Paraburkholderia nemoris]MBK3740250.1 recombinase family protein [Paraburkholderia aspalathi]CAE6724251.1 hypothetical protein R69619_01704 [Paraburkholderia nemoris]
MVAQAEKMAKAYSYVRMSLETQTRGDSLRRQSELSQKYAEKHGLLLVSDAVYHDLGVSAFRGKNATEGALGAFIEAAESNQIEKGSYLLVESLDRLSREEPERALTTLQRILRAGINVVTLATPEKTYISGKVDAYDLIFGIMSMVRAHEESAMKAARVHASWSKKQELASEKKLTRLCPLWLELSADRTKFRPIPERVRLVERIFQETVNGVGAMLIANRFHSEKIPTWGTSKGRAKRWTESYIKKVRSNRAVLGEYVPHRVHDGKRTPLRTVEDYYPAIISQDLFNRAANARAIRKTTGGPKAKRVSNLFSSVAVCGYCGAPMRYRNAGNGQPPFLVCERGRRGDGCTSRGVPYAPLESSFLGGAREVGLKALLSGTNVAAQIGALQSAIDASEGKSFALNSRIEELTNLLDGQEVHLLKAVVDKISAIQREANSSEEETARLRAELAEHTSTAATENYERDFRDAIIAMNRMSSDELVSLRLMLQQRIAQTVGAFKVFALPTRMRRDQFESHLERMRAFVKEQDTDELFIESLLRSQREQFEKDSLATTWTYYATFKSKRSFVVRLDRRSPTWVDWHWDTSDPDGVDRELMKPLNSAEAISNEHVDSFASRAKESDAKPKKPRKPRGRPRSTLARKSR